MIPRCVNYTFSQQPCHSKAHCHSPCHSKAHFWPKSIHCFLMVAGVRNRGERDQSAGWQLFCTIYNTYCFRLEYGLLSTRCAGINLRCPRDGRLGTAYCDAIDASDVGKADFMLSYSESRTRCFMYNSNRASLILLHVAWGYTLGEMLTAISHFCKQKALEPSCTRIWICCLCINRMYSQLLHSILCSAYCALSAVSLLDGYTLW